jgi:hypothetical protein
VSAPDDNGPTILIDPLSNRLTLVEGPYRREISVRSYGTSIKIGCTTITLDAFKYIVAHQSERSSK